MRAERLDELEGLMVGLEALYIGWTDDLETPALLDRLNNLVVVFPPSSKQKEAARYFAAVRPHLLADLIRNARAVLEWREADAAWHSMTGDTSISALERLEAAEARLRGTVSDGG